MRLRTQIFSGFVFILILFLILAGVSIYYLENVGQASERILEENYRNQNCLDIKRGHLQVLIRIRKDILR